MRNQYVGDIGDYVKYALLRRLVAKKLGVIWYQTGGGQQGDDGRHTDYLHAPNAFRKYDEELFDALRRLVCKDQQRSIAEVEKRGILPAHTVFFSDPMCADNKSREGWFEKAYEKVAACDLVFVDPDNGLADDKSADTPSDKHVSLDEVKRLARCTSLLIYHHQTRVKGGHEKEIKDWQKKLADASGKRVSAIRAGAFSPRAFFLLSDCECLENDYEEFSKCWREVLHSNNDIPHYYPPQSPH